MTWSPNDSTEGLRYEVDDHCQEHVSDDHINVGALWGWRPLSARTQIAHLALSAIWDKAGTSIRTLTQE